MPSLNLFTIEHLGLTIILSVFKKSTCNDIPKKPLKFYFEDNTLATIESSACTLKLDELIGVL